MRSGLFLAGLVAAGCSVDVPLVFGFDAGGEAGDFCHRNQDCAADFYCLTPAHACGRGAGTCVRRLSATCTESARRIYEPVCGCDGVTYFNLCLSAEAGVAIERYAECPVAVGHLDCFGQCAAPAICARLSCQPGPTRCYRMPPSCPGVQAHACVAPGASCVEDVCSALASGPPLRAFELGCR